MSTRTVQVWHSHADDNGNPYYRTIPSGQLLIIVDGQWHTAVDDDCWQEAIAPVNMDAYTIDVVARPEVVS